MTDYHDRYAIDQFYIKTFVLIVHLGTSEIKYLLKFVYSLNQKIKIKYPINKEYKSDQVVLSNFKLYNIDVPSAI